VGKNHVHLRALLVPTVDIADVVLDCLPRKFQRGVEATAAVLSLEPEFEKKLLALPERI